jgi:hypothetical protein
MPCHTVDRVCSIYLIMHGFPPLICYYAKPAYKYTYICTMLHKTSLISITIHHRFISILANINDPLRVDMDMAFSSVSVTFFFLLALHRPWGEVDARRSSTTLLATNPSIGINFCVEAGSQCKSDNWTQYVRTPIDDYQKSAIDEMDSFSRSAQQS